MTKIKINKIEITIGKKVITLSLEEMKELHEILSDTFFKETVKYVPSTPVAPIWIDPPVYRHPLEWWQITSWNDNTLKITKGSDCTIT